MHTMFMTVMPCSRVRVHTLFMSAMPVQWDAGHTMFMSAMPVQWDAGRTMFMSAMPVQCQDAGRTLFMSAMPVQWDAGAYYVYVRDARPVGRGCILCLCPRCPFSRTRVHTLFMSAMPFFTVTFDPWLTPLLSHPTEDRRPIQSRSLHSLHFTFVKCAPQGVARGRGSYVQRRIWLLHGQVG
jgi:hypothetical protein